MLRIKKNEFLLRNMLNTMSVVFVVNIERSKSVIIDQPKKNYETETLGIYLTEIMAKKACCNYVNQNDDIFKKIKNFKSNEDTCRVYYESYFVKITISKVVFDIPKIKIKKKKDLLRVKKGLSAYIIYSKEKRQTIKDENPEATFGEMGKLLGSSWKNLSDDDKIIYFEKSLIDKKRYNDEISQVK